MYATQDRCNTVFIHRLCKPDIVSVNASLLPTFEDPIMDT